MNPSQTPSTPPWDDPRVTAFVMGELSGDELTEFRKEVSSHPELAAAVDEARQVTDRLAGLFASESIAELDVDRRAKIVSGANLGSQQKSWTVPLLALATAAVLLLLVGLRQVVAPESGITVAMQDDGSSEAEFDEVLEPKAENGLELRVEVVDGEEQAQSNFLPYELQGEVQSSRAPTEGQPRPSVKSASIASDKKSTLSPARTADQSRGQRQGGMMGMDMSMGMGGGYAEADDMMMGDPGDHEMAGEIGGGMRGMGGMSGGMGGMDAMGMDFGMSMSAPAPAAPLLSKNPIASGANRDRLSRSSLLEAEPGFGMNPPDIIVVPSDQGIGPEAAGDRFDPITDNAFKRVDEHPLSTFSIDVDTASYSKTRDFLMRSRQLPQPDAVRIEELVNYFDYDYAAPPNDGPHPFGADVAITTCPWNTDHRLARIAVRGKTMMPDKRPPSNLVFLIDTSGSMNQPSKLPLVVEGMKMLTKKLGGNDRVAIVVYAGSAGLVLDSTSAKKSKKIRKALTQLSAGGSTNGGAGIQLAYQTARENFIEDGVNRVILCSDGDFNVGTTGTGELVRLVEREASGGVFLTVLGFGMGNHNDAMMEQISGRGNGNYAFIDNEREARKVLVDQISSTLVTIAKDVKIQVEFNPAKVASYRLIGYENRMLAKEDFNDDTKDAGEIGAGHSVTALYEIVPTGVHADASAPRVDDLKYQSKPAATEAAASDETLTLKLRYKQPDGDTSTKVEFPIIDDGADFESASVDTRFAAAVAGFGMQLRRSEYRGTWTLAEVRRVAQSAKGEDEAGLRTEFIELVDKAAELMGAQ